MHLTFLGSQNTQLPQIWSETVFSISRYRDLTIENLTNETTVSLCLTIFEASVNSEAPEMSNACGQNRAA